MKPILLATLNPGKIAELELFLSPLHCIPQAQLNIESADETGLSFVENAIIKARHASRLSHMPALADDSGLVVHALHDEPGIYSARYAGPQATDADNLALLLERLAQTIDSQRRAYFYCALALVQHENDPTPIITTGKWGGSITKTPQGTLGFGYDPVFYLEDYQCTAAQLPAEIKNSISHRAQALKKLKSRLS